MLFDLTGKSPGSLLETQQPQIYTLNADSDIIHAFLTWVLTNYVHLPTEESYVLILSEDYPN